MNTVWNILKSIAHNEPIDQEQIQSLSSAIDSSWESYQKIPSDQKDKMRIELAQRMGCKSSDLQVCKDFIRNY